MAAYEKEALAPCRDRIKIVGTFHLKGQKEVSMEYKKSVLTQHAKSVNTVQLMMKNMKEV